MEKNGKLEARSLKIPYHVHEQKAKKNREDQTGGNYSRGDGGRPSRDEAEIWFSGS